MKRKNIDSANRRLIWIGSILILVGVGIMAVVAASSAADAEWCDKVLEMSAQYMKPHKGGLDYSSATESQIEEALPSLEEAYKACEIREDGRVRYEGNLERAGWDLALAYLRLHERSDAEEVLRTLSSVYAGSAFGDHCALLLSQE